MREIKRGDIYLADLGQNIGSVQRGERPVIVVQNNKGNRFSPTITVIPTTTKIHRSKGFPTHVILDHMGGLDEESASMAEQITTISRDKLVRYIGSLSDHFMATKIDKTLGIQLGLKADNRTDIRKEAPDRASESCEVPIWHKASLTVEEAAAYTNIGLNRIRELCKVPHNNFTFLVGRKILIKREAFDKYLRDIEAL
ncbi:helix-turn-helix domain-containing protein [Butyrivibrio sp. X503]|uniref:excisionase n=1 Tax=unclassified Butyrivibrio TaxID=2639466 RepID=UPI000EA97689|nr:MULTISPECIES: excisionase [unclassified Butyrivibrio]RKM55695.1 helix-turn-helix domain-containing protein [Butyrivibrio sp. X503]RKM63001.1 helix-turn-helix domain-containing protein [Butyrivibrio sp. XB500-5]